MMLPTDAATTTRRSSLSGTLAALIGLPSCVERSCFIHLDVFAIFSTPAHSRAELRHNITDFRPIRKHSDTGGDPEGAGGDLDAARDAPSRRLGDVSGAAC